MEAIIITSQRIEKIKPLTIVQLCPRLNIGGVERGVVDVACYLQQNGYESIVISNGGSLLAELQDNRVQHIKLAIHSKNPFIFLLNLWRLKSLIDSLKPDLLLPYSRIPTWLIYFLCKKRNIPFVSHCLGIHSMGKFGIKRFYNSVLMRGERVIANSNFTKTYFLTYYQEPPSKIRIIPRSADTAFFNQNKDQAETIKILRKQWQASYEKIVILLPARFSYRKGHETLISALKLIKEQKINDFHVVMLGNYQSNYSYYKRLTQLIADLDLINDVFFADDGTDMLKAYAAADIVLSISIEPEAFGRTIIEAQAMGRLVIASRHGGVLETIEDEVTGFLVEPGNAKALASTLIRIKAMDPTQKQEIMFNAQKSAGNFSKKLMCKRLVDLYKEIIGYHSVY